MKNKKKSIKIIIITLLIISSGLITHITHADDENFIIRNLFETTQFSGYDSTTNADSLTSIIANIVKAILSFLGIIFLILIIVGGYQWMTAGGNEETIGKAKKRIINATIGVAIVLIAYIITSFIMGIIYGSML